MTRPGPAGELRHLVVPLDATPFGEHALPLAVAVARRTGALLHLVHVHNPLPPVVADDMEGAVPLPDPAVEQARLDREQSYLDGLCRRMNTEGLRTECVLIDGAVNAALSGYINRVGADLVAMSTHARSGWRRLFHQNVAETLLRRISPPLLLVRPDEEETPDLEAEVAFRHFLVSLDGSPESERILPHALALARAFDARVTLVGVVRPSVAAERVLPDESAPDDHALMREEAAEALRYLERHARRVRHAGVPVETRVAVREDPDDAILDFVASLPSDEEGEPGPPIDLVAMETGARTGIKRMLEGSVAGAVLRRSPVPVLLHHAQDDTENHS